MIDASYKKERTTPTDGVHADAKEMNDLINALVDKDGSAAKEALEVLMALGPDMVGDDRFLHLYDVLNATLTNQMKARFIEKPVE